MMWLGVLYLFYHISTSESEEHTPQTSQYRRNHQQQREHSPQPPNYPPSAQQRQRQQQQGSENAAQRRDRTPSTSSVSVTGSEDVFQDLAATPLTTDDEAS